MNIIHLTDLYFNSKTNLPELIDLAQIEFIRIIDPETSYLLITEDIATKGQV